MAVAGSAVPFPSPEGVDPKRIRMWDPTKPGRPDHDVGDLVVAIAPPIGVECPGLDTSGGWEFDGPVLVPGFDFRPRGDLPADYSTDAAPVLGLRGAIAQLRFSARARSHWAWARGNQAFAMLMSTVMDFQNNADGKPCSFGDIMRVSVGGRCRNDRPGHAAGPKVAVLWSRVRLLNGPHYVSNTTDPQQNGHSDGVQCLGGVDHVEAGDCYLQMAGGQMFFLGREAEVCGFDSDALWRFAKVTLDHIQPWNPAVKQHQLNATPKFVMGYEGAADGIERTDVAKGLYLATRFEDCNIRGPFAKTEAAAIEQYLGPFQPIKGVSPDGTFQFDDRPRGRHKSPIWSGALRYFQPGETLPTLCPPPTVGPKHRVTTPDEALAAILATR